jgi:acyl carrier protein
MTSGARIIRMIEERKCAVAAVGRGSNLYTDLAFDSLSFVSLLVEIEDAYSIRFEISEMEDCLLVENLIAKADQKIKEASGE